MYSLPSHVCWKNQGNRIQDVNDRQKKIFNDHPLTPRSSCRHFSQFALKLLIAVRVKFQILHFCMELALSVWLFGKKMEKNSILHTTVAKRSAQKEKKGRNTVRKNDLLLFKKGKKATQQRPRFSPPSLCPSFPKAHCSAMRFLKSPTCALHMLLPGANETRQSYASPFRNKRMCEQKASPLLRCRSGPVGDL